jgi:hypothetical protein
MTLYCKETTFDRGWPRKCSNKAVGDHGMCRVHSPEAVARRRAKADERDAKARVEWDRRRAEDRFKSHAHAFYDALKVIAEGHNNPMMLAKQVIEGKAPPASEDPARVAAKVA